MNIKIDVTSALKPTVARVIAALEGAGRTELNHAMGVGVQHITTTHLMALAATRHGSAERLGASPTNFLAQAAEKVADPQAVSAGGDSAVLSIDHPGMIRAFQDVTIYGSPWLTIPLNALAYGTRAREHDKVILIPGGGGGVPKNEKKEHAPIDNSIAAYLLIHSVDQPQDRSLLPSDEEWQGAAAEGAESYLREAIAS